MATASRTLDESLEATEPPSAQHSSLPASLRATPRSLPSTEVSGGRRAGCNQCGQLQAGRLLRKPSPPHTARVCCRAQSALSARSAAAAAAAAALEAENARRAAEDAQRSRLYSVMACVREVQKRTELADSMFRPLADTGGCGGL